MFSALLTNKFNKFEFSYSNKNVLKLNNLIIHINVTNVKNKNYSEVYETQRLVKN